MGSWTVTQRLGGDQGSNTAEVEAVIKAIEEAMEADIKRIQVNLDSPSVNNMLLILSTLGLRNRR